MQVLDQVKQIVADHHGIKPDDLSHETRFAEDLGESLDYVEMIMGCEEEFNIHIPDETAGQFTTIGELASYIESVLGEETVWPPPPKQSGYPEA